MKLSNATYNILKWVVGIVLPAVATLYAALAGAWNLPYSEEVTSTLSAVVMFLGAFLSMTSANWMIAQVANPNPFTNNPEFPFPMSGDVYDALKWLAQVALPALSTAYLGLARIWMWPYPEQVSVTIMAIVAFLSTVLQITSFMYNKAKQAAINAQ